MKRFITIIFSFVFSFSLFAQTTVAEKNLGKTLEKNKNETAIFVSELDLSLMRVSESGTVTLPVFAKNKIKIVSGMDMTNIYERIKYANKKLSVTFEVKDLSSKIYSITNIEGIETIAQYEERLVLEEKKRAQEAREKWERERQANLTIVPVQVVNQEMENLSKADAAWLPGQVQDKFKSNLQAYLGMKTVVDSKSEAALKKLQAESENAARDESTSIELGKITTAKFALFTKIRRTKNGYTVSVDFTDLTTGEQLVSAISKEYSKAEYLYGTTGAVDELTLAIGNKLGIKISDLNKNLLASGSAGFSVDDQLALAKQNEAQFKKQMADYDAELSRLMTSNDINAIQNKNRIEAEKALLVEKQNAERKRQEELRAQKARADQDAKLEAERSIALKTQRDQMAKDAAAKAAEVRKVKVERQGVLGQINVLESKKKALMEIRQNVEARSNELYIQLVKERRLEEERIRNKSYSSVEQNSKGEPTEQARQRRENQVIKSYQNLTEKFFTDCEAVKQATITQQVELLTEIHADQNSLGNTKIVSSMGNELKVSFGGYEGSKNGWKAYFSLYSDDVLLYKDSFIVNYEAVSGKKAPDMITELNDSVIEEYTNNVDMYSSLLTRGDPIIYFEVEYNVIAEDDSKPSQYKFNFNKIRVINTITGKITQTSSLNKIFYRIIKPQNDLNEIFGVVQKEKVYFDALKKYIAEGMNLYTAKREALKVQELYIARQILYKELSERFVKIPGKNFAMLKTEVTWDIYSSCWPEDKFEDIDTVTYLKKWKETSKTSKEYPVSDMNWYEAIYFCNRLSEVYGFEPVYYVNGTNDVRKWKHFDSFRISGEVFQNTKANGFRLPTKTEWEYAARGGQNYTYAGSNNIDEVGWFKDNSGGKVHPVAQKEANAYGLYDMTGNVVEWVWDLDPSPDNSYNRRYVCGGSFGADPWEIEFAVCIPAEWARPSYDSKTHEFGCRIVCPSSNIK